jgi:hypothetical protein
MRSHNLTSAGYLFFTAIGILWGFKKPLAFFDFAAITSVSYTAVLRNTFNLVITTQTGDIEFGMLDQADYSGINEYIQKHGLQDASLAATRRAKKLNVNPPDDKAANGDAAAGDDGLTELQRAEMALEDLEDEDEEDYDPENESGSEGSGSDSEDEDGEEGDEDGEGEGGEFEEGYEEGYEEGEDEEMDGQEEQH